MKMVRSSIRSWDEVISKVPRGPVMQTLVPSLYSLLSWTFSQWSSSCSIVFNPRSY